MRAAVRHRAPGADARRDGGARLPGARLSRSYFDAGAHQIAGREPFLAVSNWPENASATMLAEAYDGEHAFRLYSARNGDRQVKIVEHLTVRDGRIVKSEFVVDSAAFAAFMSG